MAINKAVLLVVVVAAAVGHAWDPVLPGASGFETESDSFTLATAEQKAALFSSSSSPAPAPSPFLNFLMVPLTLIQGADSKGAVCLDGTLPGYHLHPGHGSGANNWIVQVEGGAWCDTISSCIARKNTGLGSSKYMLDELPFIGILSNKSEENPDFFNWNRVKLRYCDGASFTGDSQNEEAQLYFRGQRIWSAAIEELMSKGLQNADQVLLSGCSAGAIAAILHCDEFRNLFPETSRVKCLSDAGLFLDEVDVSGKRPLRSLFEGVVHLHETEKSLPRTCLSRMDPTSCFFPQNVIADVKTPLFLLNAAYDAWQLQNSLVPPLADPTGSWNDCKLNHSLCNSSQIQFLQDFRNKMIHVVEEALCSSQNGAFINSCFVHCQAERQDMWLEFDSPLIGNKVLAAAVGDWFFDRARSEAIECAYPCGQTCHNIVYM